MLRWALLPAALLAVVGAEASLSSSSSLVGYLQQESAAVTQAQHAVQQFLLAKQVPVGLPPLASQALRRSRRAAKQATPFRIAVSSEDNDLTCRIALTRVPVGRKCTLIRVRSASLTLAQASRRAAARARRSGCSSPS